MSDMRILLCCGAGMSSGFLSQRTRVAAKKAGMNISIEARSESDIVDFLKDVDILLIAPHLAGKLEGMQKQCDPYGIPARIIPHEIYGGLDGEGLLELCKQTLNR